MKLASASAILFSFAAQQARAGTTLRTTTNDATALNDAIIVGGNGEVALGSKSHEDVGSPYVNENDVTVTIAIHASDIPHAYTTDAPTIRVVPGSRVSCYNGCYQTMSCEWTAAGQGLCQATVIFRGNHSHYFQVRNDEAITEIVASFRVEASGGNAMMVDHADLAVVPYGVGDPLLYVWGTPNNKFGWCLSTESSDYDGNDYRVSHTCRCRLEFQTNNLNQATAWTSCSTSEELPKL